MEFLGYNVYVMGEVVYGCYMLVKDKFIVYFKGCLIFNEWLYVNNYDDYCELIVLFM